MTDKKMYEVRINGQLAGYRVKDKDGNRYIQYAKGNDINFADVSARTPISSVIYELSRDDLAYYPI